MSPEKKQAALRRLMRENGLTREKGLTRKKLAEKAGYSKAAVDSWLAPPDAKCYVEIPDRTLELVTMKVKGGL